jgi:DNA polymerase III subunit beta
MKFTIDKPTLLKRLNDLRGISESKSTIPMLSMTLITAKNDRVDFAATDLDVSLRNHAGAEVQKTGALCLPTRKLFEIVKLLPESEILIESVKKDSVRISAERSWFKLIGRAREEYPEIAKPEGDFIEISAETWVSFVRRCEFAITNEESRYALQGAQLEIKEEQLRLVATDGHRLAVLDAPFDQVEPLNILIPKKALVESAKLAEGEKTIAFARSENHIHFRIGDSDLSSRMLSGMFPNYELVLPKSPLTEIRIDADRLTAAVRRVALMADQSSKAVKVRIRDGSLELNSQSTDVGESADTITVEYDGSEIETCFNAGYLLDAIGNADEIVMKVKDGKTAIEFGPFESKDWTERQIVMPQRV